VRRALSAECGQEAGWTPIVAVRCGAVRRGWPTDGAGWCVVVGLCWRPSLLMLLLQYS